MFDNIDLFFAVAIVSCMVVGFMGGFAVNEQQYTWLTGPTLVLSLIMPIENTKPLVSAALLCESIIKDQDGIATIIKVVDTFTLEIPEFPRILDYRSHFKCLCLSNQEISRGLVKFHQSAPRRPAACRTQDTSPGQSSSS